MTAQRIIQWGVIGILVVAAGMAQASGMRRYRVRVRGISERRLGIAFDHVLNVKALQDRPPSDAAMLERRAVADIPRLRRALEARGYYAAQIAVRVDLSHRIARVIFDVEPGPQFRLGNVAVTVVESLTGRPPPPLLDRLASGAPADAEAVIAAEQALIAYYHQQGHPWAEWTDREYRLDRDERLLHGQLHLDPGVRVVFGETRVEGQGTVDETFIRKLIPWTAGERFDARQVEMGQRNLLRSGLFAMATMTHDDAPDAVGRLPILISVRERPHRTVGVGVRYRTDEGPGGHVFWRHRNLAGAGEHLSLRADAASERSEFEIEARKPAFRRHNQQGVASVSVTDERPDAFHSRAIQMNLRLIRDLGQDWVASAGGRLKTSWTRQGGENARYTLFGIPLTAVYDSRDDLLDPRHGHRLDLTLTPMWRLPEGNPVFVNIQPGIGWVRPLGVDHVRFAVRTRWSMIAGASLGAIPADERFYGGGGGSVRGYAYQSLGPLSDEGARDGGRFMIENAFEIRWRLTQRIGVCGFMDGGQVARDRWPALDNLAWGAGLGLRYHLPRVGPIRLDLAVPLDRGPSDDAYQVYVSLGQAF